MYQRSILIGMLLGDGCIKLKRHKKDNSTISIYAEYVIAHGPNQLQYLEHKRKKLHSIIGGKELKISEGFTNLSNGKRYNTYRISRCHKYFRLLHRWAYTNAGKKYFSRNLLDKLSPEGVAYWYMDDGGVSKNVNNGKITSVECRLFTYCSEIEADTIIQYFKEVYNIQWKKRFYRTNGSWLLACNTKESKKFETLIKPYVIDSMKYKLPNSYTTRQQGPCVQGEEIVCSA